MLQTHKIKKARKEHACVECGITIHPGVHYSHLKWRDNDAGFCETSTCMDCYNLREHNFDEQDGYQPLSEAFCWRNWHRTLELTEPIKQFIARYNENTAWNVLHYRAGMLSTGKPFGVVLFPQSGRYWASKIEESEGGFDKYVRYGKSLDIEKSEKVKRLFEKGKNKTWDEFIKIWMKQ